MSFLSLLEIDPQVKKRIRYWLEGNFDEKTKRQVLDLLEHDRAGLIDAFYTTLSFGTGGLRGIMGPGSNRINIYTVRWVTQGLANYLKKQFSGTNELRVAIGYDSRHQSKEFAEESARVLAGNGITALLSPKLCPTPLVSFACRYYHCQAAIMVTASHNPAIYNGYKVYWSDGAQVLPPHDTGIIEEVNLVQDLVQDLESVHLADLSDPLIVGIENEVDEAYIHAICRLQLWPHEKDHRQLNILYSNLHGTGITMVPEALRRFGFTKLGFVEEQKEPDGDFPSVARPNPEERQALQLGIDKLESGKYDLLIATDPDADRMGVACMHHGQAVILTGNQIACIAVEYICKALREMPKNGAFVKSIVTSDLFREIVHAHKATCFEVLPGFKYIAEKMRQWDSGEYQYIFGAEESYGYLLGTYVRDKDAVSAACTISEIADFAKKQGKTLGDLLEDLYKTYGVYREKLISIEFPEGKEGTERCECIMRSLRSSDPSSLSAVRIYRVGENVLILELEDQSKIIIRPSGTEPKIKIYVLVKGGKDPERSISELITEADRKAFSFGELLKERIYGS